MKITVFGGSAHSTPALWSYLVNEARLDDLELVLVGRNAGRLAAVGRACRLLTRRGSSSSFLTGDGSSPDSIAGSAVVMIQIRSGGYAARAFDESFPLQYGIPGDEGLGPGGLCAGVRNWKAVKVALEQVSRYAPRAIVLMLSSPVGLLVRAATQRFPQLNVVGICELPWTTLLQTCSETGIDASSARFNYFGINHLGWLYGIETGSRTPSNAVALKYLRLHTELQRVVEEQRRHEPRGARLDELSRTAFATYCVGNREQIMAALVKRDTPWYRHAIGPLIAALSTKTAGTIFFLSVQNGGFDSMYESDDILEYAHVAEGGILYRLERSKRIPSEMIDMLSPFVLYERQALPAVLSGERSAMEQALRAHPWVRSSEIAFRLSKEIVQHAARS